MYHFEGYECPVCNKKLMSGDDVVVCPDCGAAYHRECYKAQGACSFADRHGTGFEYKPQAAALSCPGCGAACAPGSRFCTQCGRPLNAAPAEPQQPRHDAASYNGGYDTGNRYEKETEAVPFNIFLADDEEYNRFMLKQMSLPREFDGISVEDWVTYIGPNAPSYLRQFAQQDKRKNKLGFILSAALFAPYFFCYRKMWGLGILAFITNFLLNAPAALFYADHYGWAVPFSYNAAGLEDIAWICSVLWIVVNALWGFFAAWLYRRHAARLMHRWKTECPTEESFQTRLRIKGGISKRFMHVLTFLIVFYLVSSFRHPL